MGARVVLELAIVVASCGSFGAPPEGLKAKRTRKWINNQQFTGTRVKRAAPATIRADCFDSAAGFCKNSTWSLIIATRTFYNDTFITIGTAFIEHALDQQQLAWMNMHAA